MFNAIFLLCISMRFDIMFVWHNFTETIVYTFIEIDLKNIHYYIQLNNM